MPSVPRVRLPWTLSLLAALSASSGRARAQPREPASSPPAPDEPPLELRNGRAPGPPRAGRGAAASAASERTVAVEPADAEPTEPCQRWCGRYLSFEERPRVAIGVDLLPEIGTSAGYEDNHVRHLSLNIVGGYSGGLEGLEVSTGFGMTTSHVYGVQLAGLVDLAGGNLYGVQGAGLLAAAASSPFGLQLAGAMTVAGGVPRGVQLAGGANFANDGVDGVQIAAGANLAGGLDGAQIGGVLNIVDADSAAGAQLGAVNIDTGGLAGAQIGAVNVTGPGRTAVQIGAVNVAEQTDLSLGLVNVVWKGRTHVDIWFSETGFAHVALKHGGPYVHNLYGIGVRGSGGPQASFVFGLGGHVPVVSLLGVDVDLLGHAIAPAHDEGGSVPLLGTLRVLANVRLARSVALLLGPSYSVVASAEADGGRSYSLGGDVEIATHPPRTTRGWPGLVLGVELLAPPAEEN